MSGSSFNYLCWKDASELLENQYELREMRDDLLRVFPNSRAALDTDELVRLIDHLTKEVQRRRKALQEVWHAQEWWRSNDYGKDQVDEAIAEYEAGCK